MMPIRRALIALLCGLPLFGCSAGESAKVVPITLHFDATVGTQPFACGRIYDGIGLSSSSVTPVALRFYVAEIELIDAAGRAVPLDLNQDGIWQYRNVALLDFADGTGRCRMSGGNPNRVVTGTVPAGDYRGLRFTLGVPFALDHADAAQAPPPLNTTAMFWNWQNGYKFLSLGMAATTAAATAGPTGFSGMQVHLGSTECTGAGPTFAPASCLHPNRVTVRFDRFDAARDTVIADVGALLGESNLTLNTPHTPPGCMSGQDDPDCAPVFAALGLPWAQRPTPAQRFFSVLRGPAQTHENRPSVATATIKTDYDWHLPSWAPVPVVPADNPVTPAKVALGRYLFYDKRLSANGKLACASCHQQARAFTDGLRNHPGIDGEPGIRNPMSLTNVAYLPTLTWSNPLLKTLEAQALVPLFGEHPVEMGMAGREAELFARLNADTRYPRLFKQAFPERDGAIDLVTLTRALASFERTLLSFDSPYDRYRHGGEVGALSPSARRGEALFFGERLECYHCHGGIDFTDNHFARGMPFAELGFHNTGLYNLDGHGAYPPDNPGLREFTGEAADEGRFRTPTLRNIALSAPYMHDGSVATLAQAIRQHYAKAGRAAGSGKPNPLRDPLIAGFAISADEVRDLVVFLESLTDRAFVTAPQFADPCAQSEPGLRQQPTGIKAPRVVRMHAHQPAHQ